MLQVFTFQVWLVVLQEKKPPAGAKKEPAKKEPEKKAEPGGDPPSIVIKPLDQVCQLNNIYGTDVLYNIFQ